MPLRLTMPVVQVLPVRHEVTYKINMLGLSAMAHMASIVPAMRCKYGTRLSTMPHLAFRFYPAARGRVG